MSNSSLAQALSKLDPTNDNHWTQDGLPRLETLKMLTANQGLTREAISSAFPLFTRSNSGVVIEAPVITPPVITPPVVIVHTGVSNEESNAEQEQEATEEEVVSDFTYEQAVLENLEMVLNEAKAAYEKQLALVDKFISDSQNDFSPAEDSQIAIQKYHASQLQMLEARGRQVLMIAESGLDLKQLANGLKAPIDRPKSRRR